MKYTLYKHPKTGRTFLFGSSNLWDREFIPILRSDNKDLLLEVGDMIEEKSE